jgi:hypothetical protein
MSFQDSSVGTVTLYHDGLTSLAKFETFLQRLLWDDAFGDDVVVFRLKANVALEDGRSIVVQVYLCCPFANLIENHSWS